MALTLEHARQRIAAALADHHDNLALARLVFGKATVEAIFTLVGRLDVAAEIAAVDFRDPPVPM